MTSDGEELPRLVILGCGGHARSIAEVALDCGRYGDICFIDENAREGETILGFEVRPSLHGGGNNDFIVGIGDNQHRAELFGSLDSSTIAQLLSPLAHLGRGVSVGCGTFAAHFCYIGPMAAIGYNCIINTGAVVEHEVEVGNHSHIGPNATVSGRSRIGEYAFLGAGSTVIDKISICPHVTIGAGSVVVSDIEEPGTYAGSPARRMK